MLRFGIVNIVILLTVLAFVIQNQLQNVSVVFGLNLYCLQGLYFQLISNMFVHANFEHLFFNMLVLWQFGTIIEKAFGKLYFVGLYFIGGVLTSIGVLGYLYMIQDWTNVVGASGAISVLLGFVAKIDKFNQKGILIWFMLITFAPILFGENIAWYAHLIGFFIGWIVGSFKKQTF